MTPHQKKNVVNWIRALRSGDYQQGQDSLYENGGYCCLGVFYHISNERKPRSGQYYLGKKDLLAANLTDKQQKRLGQFNDEKSLSFKWIATWLERYHLKEKVTMT